MTYVMSTSTIVARADELRRSPATPPSEADVAALAHRGLASFEARFARISG
jgi:hypothetical protein